MSKHKLIYQIYPTAIGTLSDISEKIPLLSKLGINYIWLSPIFFSPWVDGGYDVADYRMIDPRFGTMRDFKHLIAVCNRYNIGILLDLVLNHTSSEHKWFKLSRLHNPTYRDYYVWRNKPLNWGSFFGGPAFDYDSVREQYYLHLYDRSQPDLNFDNPRVIKEFKDIIRYWTNMGVAGFRVDSANILADKKYKNGYIPRIAGFFNYYQSRRTLQVLEELFANKKIFTIAEPVGGNFMSKRRYRELTDRAFDVAFNIGTLDVADTLFSMKDRIQHVNYRAWFKKLADWTPEEKFSFALENHDTPRAVSRFHADPKVLAMLQFLLPCYYPCIYQGQELGTANPKLSNNIRDYPGVQSRKIYSRLRAKGKTRAQAMSAVKQSSRDNARQPIDWSDYYLQDKNPDSVLNFYRKLISLWRTDPVIANGKLKVIKTTKEGVFDFQRIYKNRVYTIHLDLSNRTPSTLKNDRGTTIVQSR